MVSREWLKFLHIVAAIGFVGIHGAAITVLYVIRGERDRRRIEAALDFSARTAFGTYLAMVAVAGTGLWMGLQRSAYFSERWYWLSLVLLVLTGILMLAVAKPFTKRVRLALEIRPSGVPRVADEELAHIVRSPRAHAISAIGVVALVAITYLMVFQPPLGAGEEPDTAGPPASPEVLALGREVFEVTAGEQGCAECHGIDGRGTADAPDIVGVSKAKIRNALDEEREMADIELSAEELEAVYQYLQTLP